MLTKKNQAYFAEKDARCRFIVIASRMREDHESLAAALTPIILATQGRHYVDAEDWAPLRGVLLQAEIDWLNGHVRAASVALHALLAELRGEAVRG